MNRRVVAYCSTVIMLLALAGCASREEKELKKFVEDYNKTLQTIYRTANLNPLGPYATENELARVFPIIQALSASDSIMPTEIKKFNAVKAEISAGGVKALVETRETWEYRWENKKTGRIVKPSNTESYHLRYYILKQKNGWKVDRIELLDENK